MINLTDLSVFVAALVAVYVLPGPDMALILSTSAMHGMRNGLMTALGLALSRSLHVTLAALGLAALFHTHPLLFATVRWLGAGYLVWMAWKVLTSTDHGTAEQMNTPEAGLAALRKGFLTNLLNPKALMFCALLLPQFVSAHSPLAMQYLVLGSILVGIGLLFDVCYTLAAARLAQRVTGSPTTLRLTKGMFAGVFGLAALRLATSSQ